MMELQKGLLDLVFPIGRGFMDFTDTDYSRYLGFTWERELLGVFPLGADDTTYPIGSKGGASSRAISKDNLPNYTLYEGKHKHTVKTYSGYSDGTSSKVTGVSKFEENVIQVQKDVSTSEVTIKVTSGGKGEALNTMPPYKAVYYWKRVA